MIKSWKTKSCDSDLEVCWFLEGLTKDQILFAKVNEFWSMLDSSHKFIIFYPLFQ